MYKITDLKNAVPSVITGNRYNVILENPASGGNIINSFFELDKVSYYCPSISLPGLNLNTIQRNTHGTSREIVHSKIFGDLTIDFLFDADGINRKYFENWMAFIQNPDTNYLRYYDDYIANLYIEILDETNSIVSKIKFYEVYPLTINSAELSYDSSALMLVGIKFAYNKYEYLK